MNTSNEWLTLSVKVNQLEQQGMAISENWYDFQAASPTDVDALRKTTAESEAVLSELTADLDRCLRQDLPTETRSKAQYAYNMAQELLSSRAAVHDMLDDITSRSVPGYLEYYRAIALKERAARMQTGKLKDIIRDLSENLPS